MCGKEICKTVAVSETSLIENRNTVISCASGNTVAYAIFMPMIPQHTSIMLIIQTHMAG